MAAAISAMGRMRAFFQHFPPPGGRGNRLDHGVQATAACPRAVRIKVRIGQGQKGPEVTEVIEVDTSTTGRSARRSSSQLQPGVGATTECIGSVKMYNRDRGFGFVGQDGGGKDVFVHATTLGRSGLSELAEGQRVRMQIGQGQKGLEARSIELLD